MLECKDGYNYSDAVPHRLGPCNAPTLPCYRAAVGALLETTAASNLCAPTPARWRAPPRGTQSQIRCRAQVASAAATAAAARPPPWASSRRPRIHIRRRLRRAARCVGVRTCTARARALSAIDPCLIRAAGTSWPDLGVRAHLLRSARASRRAAKGPRRSMASGEIVVSRSVLRPIASDAPGAVEPAAAGWMRALVCARRGSAKKV